ncbi:hypothetical protein [Vibrio mediterranei]|uniref:hypothetical protein n=1 Tax=Vibrio mediterranei TaxID=689 RepID=UPI0040675916
MACASIQFQHQDQLSVAHPIHTFLDGALVDDVELQNIVVAIRERDTQSVGYAMPDSCSILRLTMSALDSNEQVLGTLGFDVCYNNALSKGAQPFITIMFVDQIGDTEPLFNAYYQSIVQYLDALILNNELYWSVLKTKGMPLQIDCRALSENVESVKCLLEDAFLDTLSECAQKHGVAEVD